MSSKRKSAARVVRSQTAPPPSHGRLVPSATSSPSIRTTIDLTVPRHEVVNVANAAGPSGTAQAHQAAARASPEVKSEHPRELEDGDFKVKEIREWKEENENDWIEYQVFWGKSWVPKAHLRTRGRDSKEQYVVCAEREWVIRKIWWDESSSQMLRVSWQPTWRPLHTLAGAEHAIDTYERGRDPGVQPGALRPHHTRGYHKTTVYPRGHLPRGKIEVDDKKYFYPKFGRDYTLSFISYIVGRNFRGGNMPKFTPLRARRALTFCASFVSANRHANFADGKFQLSAMIYIKGMIYATKCSVCDDPEAVLPFEFCVTAEGFADGACANCIWLRNRSHCDHHVSHAGVPTPLIIEIPDDESDAELATGQHHIDSDDEAESGMTASADRHDHDHDAEHQPSPNAVIRPAIVSKNTQFTPARDAGSRSSACQELPEDDSDTDESVNMPGHRTPRTDRRPRVLATASSSTSSPYQADGSRTRLSREEIRHGKQPARADVAEPKSDLSSSQTFAADGSSPNLAQTRRPPQASSTPASTVPSTQPPTSSHPTTQSRKALATLTASKVNALPRSASPGSKRSREEDQDDGVPESQPRRKKANHNRDPSTPSSGQSSATDAATTQLCSSRAAVSVASSQGSGVQTRPHSSSSSATAVTFAAAIPQLPLASAPSITPAMTSTATHDGQLSVEMRYAIALAEETADTVVLSTKQFHKTIQIDSRTFTTKATIGQVRFILRRCNDDDRATLDALWLLTKTRRPPGVDGPGIEDTLAIVYWKELNKAIAVCGKWINDGERVDMTAAS
ncbi:hypothetical protein LTR17_000067 [Elasticomyces elasticus]|nr:hypothetical protein LTR17_000067 [Elasticomyces elasticus]